MITHLAPVEDFVGEELEIADAAYRHLFRARRLATGERLRIVDGLGSARWGEISHVERRLARVKLGEPAPSNEPSYQLDLVVAALRSERASWLVEKATEIGVHSVRFVATRRTPRSYSSSRLERLRRVAAAAVSQCHRSRWPEVLWIDAWDQVPELVAASDDRFVLDVAAEDRDGAGESGRDQDDWRQDGWHQDSDNGVVLVGPEGGWSADELRQLEESGCRRVGLGARTLRAETAAVAAAGRLLLR